MLSAELTLALVTFLGSFIGAILTASAAIFISRRDLKKRDEEVKRQENENRRNTINDIDSEIELNIYNAEKIAEIDLHKGMVYNNPEETCEDCYYIVEKLEELEKEIQSIIKPLKSINSKPKEINKDIVVLVKLIDERRVKFKNMTRMYKNNVIKGMKISSKKNMTYEAQTQEVKDSLIGAKGNVNKDLKEYIAKLEEFRHEYLSTNNA